MHNGQDQLYISRPLRNRVNGRWMISLSRPILAQDGTSLGVIMGALDITYFERFHNDLKLHPDIRINLLREDGTLLATSPWDDERMAWASGPCQEKDGTITITSSAAILPVTACLSTPTDSVLAQWRRTAWLLGVLLVLAVIGQGLLSLVLIGKVRLLRRHSTSVQEELEQQVAVRTAELLKAKGGRRALRKGEERVPGQHEP